METYVSCDVKIILTEEETVDAITEAVYAKWPALRGYATQVVTTQMQKESRQCWSHGGTVITIKGVKPYEAPVKETK